MVPSEVTKQVTKWKKAGAIVSIGLLALGVSAVVYNYAQQKPHTTTSTTSTTTTTSTYSPSDNKTMYANFIHDNLQSFAQYPFAAKMLLTEVNNVVLKRLGQNYTEFLRNKIINPDWRQIVNATEHGGMFMGLTKESILPLINASGTAADVIAENTMKEKMLPFSLFYVDMKQLKYGYEVYPDYFLSPGIINGSRAELIAADNIGNFSQIHRISLNALNGGYPDSSVLAGISQNFNNPTSIPDLTALYRSGTSIAHAGIMMIYYAPEQNKGAFDESRVEEGICYLWSVGLPGYRIDNHSSDGGADGQLGYFVTKSDLDLLHKISQEKIFVENTYSQAMQSFVTREFQTKVWPIPVVQSDLVLSDSSVYTYYKS